MAISLDKEQQVAKSAPHLISLVKAATVSLAKANLSAHSAKVALALDVSGSMEGLVEAGTVQRVCDRALALGLNFDDDGEIDVFLFGRSVRAVGTLSASNINGFVKRIWGSKDHEAADWQGTNYGPVISAVTRSYFTPRKEKTGFLGLGGGKLVPVSATLPSYVIFITDGENDDPDIAGKAIIEASYGPVFWQFIGVGQAEFKFLRQLDEMNGRYTDNANFFSVGDVDALSDSDLFSKMMTEYPDWISRAKGAKLLP